MKDELKSTENVELYSQRSIGIATFLGGPLAAGYLICENCKNLDQPDNGKKAFVLGVVSTILLFVGIFSIPDSTIDSIPNQLFPAIYTAVILLLVHKFHGSILELHKENGYKFYSGWRAAGIGFISMLILLAGILGYDYLTTDYELYENYESEMEAFTLNESQTIDFYDDLETKSNYALLQRIDNFIIPNGKRILK